MLITKDSSVTGDSLIACTAVKGDAGSCVARNPATGEELEPAFGLNSYDQLRQATRAAEEAFDIYRRVAPAERASFLLQIADNIDAIGPALTKRAMAETGLTEARLDGERIRTANQLRLFADVVSQGDHLGVRIDPGRAGGAPDLRQRHIPVGPVAVFGASNFPLAFSTAGGDTASALAAGCPVIVKAHNAHLGTAELVGRAVAQAVRDCNLPGGVFSLIFGDGRKIGQQLVADPAIKAVGFTGSRAAGTSLMATAAARPEPIPVYAEMSSINPVFVLPGALRREPGTLAKEFVASLTLGAGQFCTNPGLVFVPEGDDGDTFVSSAAEAVTQANGQTMLSTGIAESCMSGIRQIDAMDSIEAVARGQAGSTSNAPAPALFTTTIHTFVTTPSLQDEIFGSVGLFVRYSAIDQLESAALALHGQLTATIQCTPTDHGTAARLLPILERRAGRLVVNGWPTGVEVNHAVVHGGPFPATSDSRTTSVGSLAIERFQRPVSYQNMPDDLLPAPLREGNPWRLRRRIDGTLQGLEG